MPAKETPTANAVATTKSEKRKEAIAERDSKSARKVAPAENGLRSAGNGHSSALENGEYTAESIKVLGGMEAVR
ncbi:MAG: hypothetical protein ACRD2Q_12105 [Terriglobales bacterium]